MNLPWSFKGAFQHSPFEDPSWSRWSVTVPSFATWKAEDLWRFSHHFRCLWACHWRSLSHAPGESYPPSVNALFQPGVFQLQCEPPESTPVEPMRPGNWKLERRYWRHIEDSLKFVHFDFQPCDFCVTCVILIHMPCGWQGSIRASSAKATGSNLGYHPYENTLVNDIYNWHKICVSLAQMYVYGNRYTVITSFGMIVKRQVLMNLHVENLIHGFGQNTACDLKMLGYSHLGLDLSHFVLGIATNATSSLFGSE